jgi:cytochrome c biogenesis protein CcdA/thiol-disulfide isomerase/thioredoxin
MLFVQLGIAFLAGIITAISPCVLPVLPIIFAGGASGGRRRPYAIIAGLVASFATFTLFATWILHELHLPQDFLRNLSVGLLFLLAATLLFPPVARLAERPFLFLTRRRYGGDLGGGFLLGASLGLVFAPCAGTVLTTISVSAARFDFGWRVILITIAYSLGVALPMLAVAAFGHSAAHRLRIQAVQLRAALGAVVALAALAIVFDADRRLQTALPNWTNFLQSHTENSSYAHDQLASVHGRKAASRFTSSPDRATGLKDYGPAPDFAGIDAWLNTARDRPLSLSGLRGKVVLVDFWTYSCINCLRTLPHLEAWDAHYRKAGLVIVGVHTPEFAFERVVSNVRKATRDLGVRYPVAIDDGYKTWDAYQNDAWPAEYLIDRRGHVREIKKGEGDYDGTERSIQALLGEPASAQLASVRDTTPTHPTTPESYLGWERLERYAGSEIVPDRLVLYRFPRSLPQDTLAYEGFWSVDKQRIVAGPRRPRLRLHFYAQDVHLVLAGSGRLQVLVGGKPVKSIHVGGLSRLYTLLRYPSVHQGVLELRFTRGISAYAFTFG